MTKFRFRRALVVGVLTVIASAALVSVVQAARSASGERPAAALQYPKKVTICHRTKSQRNPFVTITVSRNAVPAHLRHGDRLGPCSAQSFTICHKNKKAKAQKTMKVRFRALRVHMRHGDRLGRCKTKTRPGNAGRKKPKRP